MSEKHEVVFVGVGANGVGGGIGCDEFGSQVFFPEPLLVGGLIDEPGGGGGLEPVVG